MMQGGREDRIQTALADEGEAVGCWLFVPHQNVRQGNSSLFWVTGVKIMSGVGKDESPDSQDPKITQNSKEVQTMLNTSSTATSQTWMSSTRRCVCMTFGNYVEDVTTSDSKITKRQVSRLLTWCGVYGLKLTQKLCSIHWLYCTGKKTLWAKGGLFSIIIQVATVI